MGIFRRKPGLLRAFRDGRREALAEVYWANIDVVAAVARRGATLVSGAKVAGVWSDEHHDLVQETFARAFSERARLAYDGLRDYRPYLLTVCRNLLADWARQRGREVPEDVLLRLDQEPDPTQAAIPQAWEEPAVVIATARDQQTHEWDAYAGGVFTHQVISGLRGAADVNRDGRVEYSEVHAFLTSANRWLYPWAGSDGGSNVAGDGTRAGASLGWSW